jgi:arylsulfatase A
MNLLKITVSLFICLILTGCNPEKNSPRPNIILILADDLGYNDLSCYRHKQEQINDLPSTSQTPNIDRLADEGKRFTNFYCGAAVCSPSRSALLTGRNATRVGIYNWIPGNQPMHLRSREITLAEMLKQVPYSTAHFGKWHLTAEGMGQPLPTDQGYDYSFFTYNNANPSHRDPVNFFRAGEAVGELKGYSCQLVLDETLKWLRSREDKEIPFYINVWFNEPHARVAAPEELADRHAYNPEYYGCIENMDLAVGRLLAYLEQSGLEQNTIVIFTSDNGSYMSGSNDPLRGRKALNYEGGVRTPFIIRWPGHVPAGSISASVGSFTDILPSMATLTQTEVPDDRVMDGVDISQVLLGREPDQQRGSPVFFFRYFHDPVCMLREGRWILLGFLDEPLPYRSEYNVGELAKLKPDPENPNWSMWNFQEKHMEYLKTAIPVNFQLYDVEKDMGQRDDVSADFPEIVNAMKEKMLRLREEMIAEGDDWYGGQ